MQERNTNKKREEKNKKQSKPKTQFEINEYETKKHPILKTENSHDIEGPGMKPIK